MHLKHLLFVGATASTACGMDYTKNGLVWSDALRMNQMQNSGTHNSYHVEPSDKEKAIMLPLSSDTANLFYTHDPLDVQLGQYHARNLELDLLADPKGGLYAKPVIRRLANEPYPSDPAYKLPGAKVLHIPDLDVGTRCATLKECLGEIKTWLDANPKAVPLGVIVEFKEASPLGVILGGAPVVPWDDAKLLAGVDAEIRSVFGAHQLITPDDVRRPGLTLEQSILQHGWPTLDSARGRIFFLMDNEPDDKVTKMYRKGNDNLAGRVLFTNSLPGRADCAFQKLDNVVTEEYAANIQKQVRAGYWVRASADDALGTVKNCTTTQRDLAFKSGAQLVSSDFIVKGRSERYGCKGYVVQFEGGKMVRCNPVIGGKGCVDGQLEG